ncbi:MAG: DUF1538 domain-containing protein [Ruminococcaceae bacterium]|nr:DUF1538 domain-containing protein [Oscillospiraceae bacterium]
MRHIFASIKESLISVLPIALIVLLLSVTCVALEAGVLVLFLFGTILLILGISFFTVGSGISMEPLGDGIGKTLNKKGKLILPLLICFVLGFLITVSEPDLQVLAEQVPTIPNAFLIGCVGIGVGAFLTITFIRNKWEIPLRRLLVIFYALIIVLAFFAPKEFIPTAFDSGGVASGPMTSTFMLPFAMGACEAIGGNVMTDAFGIVAMIAMAPLITIQILGLYERRKHARKVKKLHTEISMIKDDIVFFDTEGGVNE